MQKHTSTDGQPLMTGNDAKDKKDSDFPRIIKSKKDAVILAPHMALKEKASGEEAFTFDAAAINKAEKALEELSVNFEDWINQEVIKLDEARLLFLEDQSNLEAHDLLFQISHDLKGHATTFGYPIAREFCVSLCRLLENFEDHPRIPAILINQHVDAVRALVREKVKTDNDEKALRLLIRLKAVTNECIVHELRRTGQLPPA